MHWLSWDLNLKIRLLGETLFHTLFWMFFPFMALYFSDAFGKNVAGILLTVPPLVGIFGNLLGGYLSDRFGRRPAMLLGSFMQAAMFALFALSANHWVDYLAYIGIGLGGSIYWPASSAMVADLTPEEERRVVFATFYTAMNIGVVLGPVLGSIFFLHYRSALLLTCTVVTLAYALAIFFLIRETLPETAKKRDPSAAGSSLLKEQWQSYAVILQDKAFALYIAAGILVAITFMQLDLYLAVYVKEFVPAQTLLAWNGWSFSLNSTEVFGWMVGLNGLLVVLFTLPVTRWFEHWSDRNALIFSSVVYGLGMFFIGLTTQVWLLFGCAVILTLGELIRTPVVQSFVSKYAPEDARGQYMGASSLQFSIGRFLAPLTIWLSAWMPPIGVFGIILLCSLLSALLYVKLFQILPDSRPVQAHSSLSHAVKEKTEMV
ncbi:MFS transporter [Brevibacillus sp. SYP-B805]|uniref:MDR family MFS transporter n=1 Tax=Brevibacillus sp. SYP-B805 TaxID=1578199 RepID=UPI0013ECAC82|nr:MFS transporter [Brevibacillus sp. SYP-B805]NGQ96194.1 MFS transporter [Brevibacillus sp. SYP-B805]